MKRLIKSNGDSPMKIRLAFFSITSLIAAVFSFQVAAAAQHEVIQLATPEGSGDGKEVTVLVDQDHLKLATIVLRKGTALPTHSTPVPATIQVLEGEGVIHVAGKPESVSTGSIVLLAAGQEHDVVPKSGTSMHLLVHYLRNAPDGNHADHKPHSH